MAIDVPGYEPGFGIGEPHFRSLCVIIANFGIGPDGLIRRRNGTGFLFHSRTASSYVLTAGHNLYHHELGRFAREAHLWMGRRGDTSEASRAMRACKVPDAFSQSPDPTAEDDYGVIKVSLLGPDRFTPIGLTRQPAARVRLSGYPNEGEAQGSFQPFHGLVDLAPAGADNFSYDDKPSYIGQSGAPLLLPPGPNGWQACGLHIRGLTGPEPPPQARAVRFTDRIFEQLSVWLPDHDES